MSLKFIVGTASYDHHQTLVKQLKTDITTTNPGRFFYLVPNHIKFESEVALLKELKDPASKYIATTQVQVFSFSRLAWYFMKNTPYYQIPRISTAGLNMLVYRLLQEHAEQLTLFSGEVNQTGFVAQLTSQLLELKVGCITPEDLMQIAKQLAPEQVELTAKLHDLTIIATAFEAAMQKNFIENTALIDALTVFLKEQTLQDCHFYIEGFAQFSAQEQELLTVLMQQASLTVALITNHVDYQRKPEKNNFFYQAGRTYYQLYQQAKQKHVPIMTDQIATKQRVSPTLLALDQYWIASESHGTLPIAPTIDSNQLQVIGVENRYAELRFVAREIRRLVQTGHYRYRDFLIMTRHLAPYETMMAPIFMEYEIPYFSDLPTTMATHPLVAMLAALFNVKDHYYRYEDVMALLKTELLIPGDYQSSTTFRADLDLCENLILKSGYEGYDWLRDDDWQYYRFGSFQDGVRTTEDEALTKRVNRIRHYIKTVLPPFYQHLDAAKTGRDAAQVLYQFLIAQGVDHQLLNWRDQALAANQLTLADQPEQTWQTFMLMLDEYVTLLGDQPFSIIDFWDLLAAGFDTAQYAKIPSTLDQVVISESGMVQTKNRKITFMIGATDQVMPDQIETTTLLSDHDRQLLVDHFKPEQALTDDSATQMSFEPYLNYLAYLSSTEGLYFTYPLNNGEGGNFTLSPYVERIKQYFHLTEQTVLADISPTSTAPITGSWRSLLSDLIQVARQAQATQMIIPERWLTVYRLLQKSAQSHFLTNQLLQSLTYRNQPVPLTNEIVYGLYGTEIHTSISKLEEFYQNQYAYFLKYGLKLNERPIFELTPANTGDFYHQVLDQFIKLIQAQRLVLSNLDNHQIDALTDEILQKAYEQPEFKILNKSARMGYIRQQLSQTIKRVSQTLRDQSQRTNLQPLATEVLFGQVGAQQGLAGLEFELSNQRRIKVRGKIDRIDQLILNNQAYLGIVDYKSSQHSFNFRDAYYGLALQMLTYLETVLQDQAAILPTHRQIKPAGAFYLHLQNPTLSLKQLNKQKRAQLQNGMLDKLLLDQFKYDGLILNDETLLENLDTAIESGYSPLFNFNRTKSGTFNSKQLVTQAELNQLIAHNDQLIQAAGEAIFAGEDALNPIMRPDRSNALTMSPYKSIFQFDAMLPENNYRQLKALNNQEVLAKLRHEEEDFHE
ncbi:PD-(D/E)XK nuclease family protein [Latilactobacillus graminis]|nr:PD-(D/E)XK nuclease family protein [Latilactobacillus graminis]QFP79583.1 ATP-dependent helicase [Latilactobacillus graminis]